MLLKQLTEQEYQDYLGNAIENYANELKESGMVPEDKALFVAKDTFANILPEGLNTKGNFLYNAFDQDTLIGFIWYCMRTPELAFIYDFFILEDHRKKGFGKQVMKACEEDAKTNGAKAIGLHVFGHNKAARALYESIGYVPTSIQMKKQL